MSQYQSSAELKASAKEHMFGKYSIAVGAELLSAAVIGYANLFISRLANTSTVGGIVIYYLISFLLSILAGLFTSGTCFFYLKIVCERPVIIGDIFYGFKLCPDKAVLMTAWISTLKYVALLPSIVLSYQLGKRSGGMIFNDLLLADNTDTPVTLMLLYSLAVIFSWIVSVFVSLLYSQAFFLLHDFPKYSAGELLAMSRKLMAGQKGRLFYIYASFVPLFLLSLLSCGIALLWVIPYMNSTLAAFFLDIIKKSKN